MAPLRGLLAALLVACSCGAASAFRDGDFIHTARKAQFHQVRAGCLLSAELITMSSCASAWGKHHLDLNRDAPIKRIGEAVPRRACP